MGSHQYLDIGNLGGPTTLSKFTANATTSSTIIVAANPKREYLILINESDTPVYLAFGEAAIASRGIYLGPLGGAYEMKKQDGNLVKSAVYAIHGGSGNKVITGVEG